MRKICFAAFLLTLFLNVHSQKNYSLTVSSNFNFLTNGISLNDAGIGFSVSANAFAKGRLQLKADASLDHFIGDKQCLLDAFSECYESNPTMLNFRIGPEFFMGRISLTTLYGYVTYKFFDYRVHSGNFKLALNAHLGKQKRILMGTYYTTLTGEKSDVHFWGLNIGYRIR